MSVFNYEKFRSMTDITGAVLYQKSEQKIDGKMTSVGKEVGKIINISQHEHSQQGVIPYALIVTNSGVVKTIPICGSHTVLPVGGADAPTPAAKPRKTSSASKTLGGDK